MLTIKSRDFADGSPIPKRFTQDGSNISPRLEWSGVSPSIKEFALICEDPDAPKDSPIAHWMIYGIDSNVRELPEGVPVEAVLKSPRGARQGKNSNGECGYMGPKPPSGDKPHRYYFRLFALDEKLGLKPELSKDDFFDLIESHIVAEAELVGRYQNGGKLESKAPKVGEEAAP
jgi:Raf kinase inhibitor-like YbhB/YbcL family protein